MTEEQRPYKTFQESIIFGDGEEEWEVLTDTGYQDIKGLGMTVPMQVWRIELNDGIHLEGAGQHIVFDGNMEEVFIEDLRFGDSVMTEAGVSTVLSVVNTGRVEELYDIQLQDDNRRLYTNSILSHNSTWLNNMACNSVREGRNTAIITLELMDKKYMKRMGSNLLRIPITDYDKYAKDGKLIKKRIDDLAFANMTGKLPGRLFVKEFPTSSANIFDIENYLLKMQDKHKIELEDIYIDYINIMSNYRNPNTENTYMKIKQIAEDARAMMQRNNWAGYSATQSKAAYFDKNDMDLNAASESSGLVATVDAMYGIIIDAEMRANNEYKLKILANRDGGYMYASKMFKIDKRFLLITEDMSSPIIEQDS